MAPESGLEPETFRLGGGRSILLSYKGKEESHEFNTLPVYHRKRRGTTREADRIEARAGREDLAGINERNLREESGGEDCPELSADLAKGKQRPHTGRGCCLS